MGCAASNSIYATSLSVNYDKQLAKTSDSAESGKTTAPNTPKNADKPAHTITARYDLMNIIGRGGYAVVVEGADKETGERVAIKVVPKEGLAPHDLKALKTEVSILASLHHGGIVRQIDVFETKEEVSIVMEFLGGGELFDRIVKKTCYTELEARDAARCVLSAIKYMHDRNIVHRDLKPENLLLTSDDEAAPIKIADFGFATEVDGFNLTQRCGTPSYIAPEIIGEEWYGKPCDMWSFGVILFILLCGYPPFFDTDNRKLFRKIQSGHFGYDPRFWDAVSPEAKDLIKGLLNVNPRERLTVDQALHHPWILKCDKALSMSELSVNLDNLKDFQSTRKLRAKVNAIVASTKLSGLAKFILGSTSSDDVCPTVDDE